jgi:hypothetical protein
VFHFNERYLEEELDAVASRVARICTHVDAMPVLVALGPCHGDGKIAWEIGERLDRAALVVDRPESLREVAACIEHSVGYLGTSLHGLITAGAFERPALVVARESTSGAAKFSGFLNQWHDARAGMPTPRAGLVSTWAKAESVFCNDRFHSPNVEGELEPGLGTAFGSIPERMDAHWSAVADALIRPPNLRKSHRGGSRLALEGILQRSWRSREIFLEVLREQEERRAAG